MSYDVRLVDPVTMQTVVLPEMHFIVGGTYAMGGTEDAWLNITWNYMQHFARVFGEEGIRTIYGMTAAESLPLLKQAAGQLGDDRSDDYWEATEGNAKAAIEGLIALAEMAPPDSVWGGD